MKYLEKTRAHVALQGPYSRRDIEIWFKKYGLSELYYVVSSFNTKYCATGIRACEKCPLACKNGLGQLTTSCGLLASSCGETVLIRERIDQDDAENLEKFVKGLNDLRNRCNNGSNTVGSCRGCALKSYAGLCLCFTRGYQKCK